jgi:hypothetical protein
VLLALEKKLRTTATQTNQQTDLLPNRHPDVFPALSAAAVRRGRRDRDGRHPSAREHGRVQPGPERCSAGGETAWIPLELIRNIRLQPFGFTPEKHSQR